VRVFDLLEIPYDTEMIRIRRVRSIDGRPVQYAEHFYRADAFPGLFEHDLSVSLTELFSDKYGHRYGHMRYQITPTSITGDAAASLRVADGSPALLVLRISEGLNGVRDCDFEYWRHDAIVLEVDVPGA
jgi:DNA-binding GntR family transcriptional regulator